MVGIMEKIYVDVETYSEVDLKECGVFRYADDPSFEVMLFAFAYGDDPVKVIDIAQGEKIPFYVLDDLYDSGVLKLAHNAQFEITCLSRWFGKELPPEQWECTAVRASTLGLPPEPCRGRRCTRAERRRKENGNRQAARSVFCAAVLTHEDERRPETKFSAP